jgi:hypothetical protein
LRAAAATTTAGVRSLSFAALAPLRFVLKAFVGEKHLFAGSKYKLGATLRTLQDLIVVFHEPLSLAPYRAKDGRLSTAGPM